MSLDVAPVAPSPYSTAAGGPPPPRAVRPAAPVVDVVELSDIPPSPPQEVLDAMSAAARAYQKLRAEGRELRFGTDDESGRVVIEVRDLDGNVLRTIPPSELLDFTTGGGLA